MSPTKREKSQDTPIGKFWKQLKHATLNENTSTLTLKESTHFFGVEKLGSRLYLRQCYMDLYKLITEDWEDKREKDTLILGTPGIGKSSFLLYVLWKKRTEKKTVILQRRNESCLLFKKSGKVEEGTISDFADYYDRKSVYLLADGCIPPECNCKILEVSSPKKEYWLTFHKRSNVTTRYMPIWTLDELSQCQQHCFAHVSNDKLLELYKIFGGSARYVLAKAERDNMIHLEDALKRTDLAKAVQFDGQDGSTDQDISGLVFHWAVANVKKGGLVQYDSYHCEFASSYVRQRVSIMLREKMQDEYEHFINYSQSSVYYGQLRGRLFEDFAHEKLVRGGKFAIKNLKTKVDATITLPPLQLKDIKKAEEIGLVTSDAEYLKPIASNFGAVDAVSPPECLFQMTVGQHHGINLDKLKTVVDQMKGNKDSEIDFYFVVPQAAAQLAKLQSYTQQGKVIKDEALPSWTKRIVQYQLIIEFSKKRRREKSDSSSDETN